MTGTDYKMKPKKISKGYDKAQARRGRSAWFVRCGTSKSYFATEAEADAEIERRSTDRKLYGAVELTAHDRLSLMEAKRLATERGLTVWQVFQAGLDALPGTPRKIDELAEEYLRLKRAAMESGALRKATLMMYSSTVRRFADAFGHSTCAAITPEALQRFFDDMPISLVAKHGMLGNLRSFFGWLVMIRQMRARPHFRLQRRNTSTDPVVFHHSRVLELLRTIPERLRPIAALQWLAGIRPATSYRLRYEDLRRSERLIIIPGGSGKGPRREFVEGVPDAFWTWIPEGLSGRIAPPGAERQMVFVRNSWGYGRKNGVRFPHDVARHTFASHFCALTGSVAATSRALTHTSETTTKRHYLSRVPKEDGEAYFRMTYQAVFGTPGAAQSQAPSALSDTL